MCQQGLLLEESPAWQQFKVLARLDAWEERLVGNEQAALACSRSFGLTCQCNIYDSYTIDACHTYQL
jgi:hypothetical protein